MHAEPSPSSPLALSPRNLPLRVVLKVPERDGAAREVVYVLRYTRQGKLVLNRDEFAIEAPASR
ncbi:hemin uptake protein HemP [Myxococcota bacterium]|nr:hemin uptake protein HemP [Myxococcota bacterium]